MAGKIIMWVVTFGCAILFFSIGSYAKRRAKPMWFWSGVEVEDAEITDVKQYNKENGIMWQLYSLWYFCAGLAEIWSSIAALLFLLSGCSVGIVILVASYRKIYGKYKA